MAKKSGKSNAFPVEEAINAAAHFDVSHMTAGVVELLSGDKAMAEFYHKRADGAYYKPHQIYYAIYRPKSEFQAPVAPRHYQEGSGRPTVQDCEDYYNPVEPFIEGFPSDTEYPLPKGTPFFVQYMRDNSDGAGRFGILGTHEVDADYRRKTQQKFNTYIATKIIPKGGRSILRDTASRMGVKSTPVRDENGVLHNVMVTCTEVTKDGSVCGGMFKRDGRGDYVCQNCGIIFEREDKFVSEESGYDDEIEFDDEDNLEEGTTQKDLEVGGVLPAGMSAIEARLTRNINKFRAAIRDAPKDELAAKEKQHADKERSDKNKKLYAKLNGHQVYENKWTSKQAAYRRYKAIVLTSTKSMTTSSLIFELGMATRQYYNLLSELEEQGYFTLVKVGKTTIIVSNVEHVPRAPRCPAVQVMPVLPQVRYGNIQGKTINYRNSKAIVAVYDASAPTLYSRKE